MMSEKRMSSKQQTSKVVRQMIQRPCESRNLKSRQNPNAEHPFHKPCLDPHRELRCTMSKGFVTQPKTSREKKEQYIECYGNKDELVKHMSNLPCYLQQVDKEKNLQRKVLNFGVLDWERLEKWKYHEGHNTTKGSVKALSSNSNSSSTGNSPSAPSNTTRCKDRTQRKKQPLPQNSRLHSSNERRFSQSGQQTHGKALHFQDSKNAQTNAGDQRLVRQKGTLSGRKHSEKRLERDKESKENTTLGKGTSSSDLENYVFPLSSKDTVGHHAGNSTTKREERSQDCPGSSQNIVLLLPKYSPKRRGSNNFQLPESQALFNGKSTEGKCTRASYYCPDESTSGELFSEIPHSCPLPFAADDSDFKLNKSNPLKPVAMELESDVSDTCSSSIQIPVLRSENCLDENKFNEESISLTATESLEGSFDDIVENTAARGRHPSPNRRFSFSLGRVSRSFSFKERKESLSVPQLKSSYVSVKSGPIISDTSALRNWSREKANASSRGRSSPLRRLLDPFLRPRSALYAETVPQSKGNLSSETFMPMNSSESFQDKMHKPPTFQALLQLTLKNELPLFKFAVDNSNDILAATVKKLPASEKGNSSLIYAFYSVHEIKKKSKSWKNRDESVRFGYDTLGYLKVSSYYNMPDFSPQNSEDQFVMREHILYSSDAVPADKEISDFMPDKELAAIVVKEPNENLYYHREQSNDKKHCVGKGFSEFLSDSHDIGKIKYSSSTTVILPAGIHGLPNKGTPSPLINRWRSGGLCDCGGWDVGCELKILTNHDKSKKMLRRRSPDHYDLIMQTGVQQSKPTFSLVQLRYGLYSVQFSAQLSLLQAFSICLAVIDNGKLSDFSGKDSSFGVKVCPNPVIGMDRKKNFSQGGMPANYVSSPPASPVGRV